MLELAARLLPLVAAGTPVALATSIDVLGSSPHLLGSSMAVTPDGAIIGAVSGGCVEQSALEDCRALLAGGSSRVRRYGFGDVEAARAGLACGGEVDVLVHALDGPGSVDALRAAAGGGDAQLGFVVTGPGLGGVVGPSPAECDASSGTARPHARPYVEEQAGEAGALRRVFVDVAIAAPRMVVVGATETAAALVAAAAAAGYAVTVCDPRPAFATSGRFPTARRIEVAAGYDVIGDARLGWRDAVCVLGHDEDLDPLALAVALESGAGYVGGLGSRSTTERRRARLTALGVSAVSLARLRMPIGLDLGGRTPAETAVSILAEVLAVRSGASAGTLCDSAGPVHRAPGEDAVDVGRPAPCRPARPSMRDRASGAVPAHRASGR